MRPELLLLTLFTQQTDTATVSTTSSVAVATTATISEPVQEPPPTEPEKVMIAGAGEEEIVVTGSRLHINPLDAPAPMTTVSRKDIDKTGLTSIADVLQRLPVSGGALNTKFNSSGNFGFPPDGDGIGAGAAQADLRYLGSKRVLVLVDGVRWVNGSSASGVSASVDLNTIPVSMIDHVEVLEDGASAIYGSDAIAGVVNIITKKSFDGVTGGIYFGGYHHGDGFTQNYDLTVGTKKEALSIVLGLSYVRQDEIWAGDRKISSFPVPNFTKCTPNCSSATPQGRFAFHDPNSDMDLDLALNSGVGAASYDSNNPTGGSFHEFSTDDRFNYAPFNFVLTPSRRFGAFTQAQYKLTSNTAFTAKVLYANRSSKNQAAPEPLFIGPEAGNGNRLDRIVVDSTNPYNPLGFSLDASTDYFIGRRPLEAGPRLFRQFVNTWYVSGGFNGLVNLGDRTLYWDAGTAYGKNTAEQTKTGAFNSAKLQEALGPVDVCNADPGCVPFNIFGGQGPDGRGTITPEMLKYVTFVQHDVSEQEFFDATANASTDIVQLPAGGLGIAAGVEYRKLSGFFQPDAIITAGDSSDVPASPTSGNYGVAEGYAEIRIPVMADIPGIDLLDVSGAIRVSNYSTFGTEKTFKVGARYRPFEDLMLRGTWGQGFRAPAIGELFGTESRFDQTLADPCSDFNGTMGTAAPADVKANCIALGVPADGSYIQRDSQISVATGGNGELQPETSNGYTVSLVYSPAPLEGNDYVDSLDFELSYYRIDLDDAIRAVDAQVQLDQCTRTKDPLLCAGITRIPSGVINHFENKLTNIGGIKTDGIDLVIAYSSPATAKGRFYATLSGSYLLDWTERVPTSSGFDEIERAGTEVGDPELAFPKIKSTLSVGWAAGQFGASVTSRYIHSLTEDCIGFSEFPDTCSAPNAMDDNLSKNELKSTVYLDAQVTWTPDFAHDKLSLALGVNNITNAEPPACYSCALNGFDASQYDVPGVFGYVRAGYRVGD